MKKLLLALLLLSSCNDDKLKYIGQEVVDGKVSAIQTGTRMARYQRYPAIWVQTPTKTEKVIIPFEYDGRWKVGDTCLLIIEKYKEVKP